MTPADLDSLEALAKVATPGPWERWKQPYDCRAGHGVDDSIFADDVVAFQLAGISPEDAALIAASRTAIPELIAEVRRLTEWQPIETAARDGGRVWVRITPTMAVIVRWYHNGERGMWIREHDQVEVRRPLGWLPLPPEPRT